MLINELAAITGTSTRALRHYENHGLLDANRRTNRYRDFPDSAVEQVRRIRMLLDLGLNLEAVAQLLPCITSEGDVSACPAAQQRLADQIKAVDHQINALSVTRQILYAALETMVV